MQKITPCLWFDTQAEEAANFYVSLFKNAKIGKTLRYDDASAAVSGQQAGSVLTIEFTLFGQEYLAMNGGPLFKFTEAVSFIVNCDSQDEVDKYWNAFIANGGQESQCGWLKDKWGLSWQIVPVQLNQMLSDKNVKKAQATMKVMLEMKKLDLKKLKEAHDHA